MPKKLKSLSLTEASELLREQGFTIAFAGYDDVETFQAYYEQHYLPWLKGETTEEPRFLKEDLSKLF